MWYFFVEYYLVLLIGSIIVRLSDFSRVYLIDVMADLVIAPLCHN